LAAKQLAELKDQIMELLEKSYIHPSSPPWGAPIIFVLKKDGAQQMCVYYHTPDRINVKNKYPLSRIYGLFDQLHGACVFSKIDFQSGQDLLNIRECDIPKTAFISQNDLYEHTLRSFGLTNALTYYMDLMNKDFMKYLDKFVVVFIVGVLVYSKSTEEHEDYFCLVLWKL
jgi:hypothetical protein